MAYVIGKYALSTEEINGVAPQGAKDEAKLAKQRVSQMRMSVQAAQGDAVFA
jgi:hypothetical protein